MIFGEALLPVKKQNPIFAETTRDSRKSFITSFSGNKNQEVKNSGMVMYKAKE